MKPGIKTTEFWLTLLASLAGAAQAAFAGTAAGQIAGLVVMALASAGYSASRGRAKSRRP